MIQLRSAAATVLVLALAALLLLIAWRSTPWQWRAATEQAALTRWLGPNYLGDGRSAAELLLCGPMGLAMTSQGELLISDRGRNRRGRVVWRIDADGIARIVAGSGLQGKATEKQALDLRLDRPESMAVAPDGSVYLSDGFNNSVYRIDPGGQVVRFAGNGSHGFSGDEGPAASASLARPADIRLDRDGNLFIADVHNHRVRKVDKSGIISTVAGTGAQGFSPDGVPALLAQLNTPWGIGLDLQHRLLIADSGNHRVRRVERDGRLITIAGNGQQGFDGDGGPAIEASMNFPEGLDMDPNGNLYIGDEWNSAVRVVDQQGIISRVIGTGFPGKALVGGVARWSPVDDPESVLATPEGVLVADSNNGRVIRISPDGIIHLVAGRSETDICSALR